MSPRIVLFVVLATLVGCSNKFELKREAYPTQKELTKRTNIPAPDLPAGRESIRVSEWALSGPFPVSSGLVSSPHNGIESEWVTKSGGSLQLSENAYCTARETGRFLLTHKVYPDGSLERYIYAACGALDDFQFQSWNFDTSSQSLDDWMAQIAEKHSPESPKAESFAVWGGEQEGRGIAVVAYVLPSARMNPIPVKPDASGFVVLEGELTSPAKNVYGSITQGAFDAEACVTDEDIAAPSFRIKCKVLPTDRVAYFELSAGVEGSDIQSQIVVQGGVFPNNPDPINYLAPPTKLTNLGGTPTTSPDQLREQMLKWTNEVRQAAGRKSVALAEEQSMEADQAYPYYMAAKLEGRIKDSDFFVRGLSAGWKVKGEIVDSTWRGHCVGSADAASAMDSLLVSPSGRRVLLAKDTNSVAVGVLPRGKGWCTLMLGFEFLPLENHPTRVLRVMRTLNRARVANGKAKAKLIGNTKAYASSLAKRVESGSETPDDAIEKMATKVMQKYKGKHVFYTWGDYTNLDRMRFHPELLKAPNIKLSVMVAPYRIPNYPRTVYIVVMVWPK